jgi:hypothetical protein
MTKFIPQWQSRFNNQAPSSDFYLEAPQNKAPDLKSVLLGLDESVDAIDKNASTSIITDKSFYTDQPLSQQLIEATGLNPKSLNIDWNKPGDAFEPKLPLLKIRRITDASGDGSLAEVFEDGALRVNFDSSNWGPDYLREASRIQIGRDGEVHLNPPDVFATINAKDLESGRVISLGTQQINASQGSLLVNLKDKLDAVSTGSLRDQYSIEVNLFSGSEAQPQPLESFSEAITLIKPMQYGANHLGDETSNRFNYSDIGSAIGSARVYKGRGGTDFLNLEGIRSTDVLSFNGRAGIDAASASELGRQAFYGGSVFDALSLKNGDELYLQGIERLRFSDVTIDLTPNLDATSNSQWNSQVMDVNGAWRFNTGSDDVVLVSLDTGFDANAAGRGDVHGDLGHAINRTATNTLDRQSDHGHQAMSVMAAAHDGSEVAGIAPDASLWAYNVYAGGTSLYGAIDSAMNQRQGDQRLVFQGGIQGEGWWTNGSSREQLTALLDSTADVGFFSIAAGNGGPGGNLAQSFDPTNTRTYDPTAPDYLRTVSGVASGTNRFNNLASVGALQFTGQDEVDGLLNATGTDLADYSNRGKNLTLVAPTDSQSILNSGGSVRSFGGTSAANPNLAGVAALVWSENANIDGGELREILIGSAMDLGAGGFDNTFGFGLVNAESAMRRAHALYQNEELASFWANNEFMA